MLGLDMYNLVKNLFEMNLPPFVANSLMPLAKYLPRNYPLDFRRNFRDGKRILGEHKTFGGLIIGSMGGSLIGYAANLDMSYSFLSSPLSIAGDSIGSFIKRRLGKREGENFPLVDRTVWLTIYPLLYQHLNQKSISEFLGLYAITLIVGYGLHKFANDLIPKITNYIELKVNKTNSQMNEG